MRKLTCFFFCALLVAVVDARAASTIDSTNKYAWGANIGWTNWRDANATASGVVVGEYVCSGYIWAANVGWINVGSGTPANGIQYLNNSATDFGINYQVDPTQPGVAVLRGLAYGANIGWINFEATGNPRMSLFTGQLNGYAYSANCGWINLNDANGKVQTTTVAMGIDTDGDGIADAFELLNTNPDSLAAMDATSDTDHDGVSDLDEYREGTDPLSAADKLRIISISASSNGTSSQLMWASTVARLYQIETTTDLSVAFAPDTNFGTAFAPDSGVSTTKTLPETASGKRFFRVISVKSP